jgi:uncharacterized protein involved in outer membrane biogenesis
MNNVKRKILIALAIFITCLCLLYAAIYVVSTYYLNPTEIKRQIISRANNILHRDLTISNDLTYHITWDLTPEITVHDLTLANIKGGKQENMLTASSLKVKIDLIELLHKNISITGVTLIDPVINLETIDGVNNWDFGLDKTQGKNNITIKGITIEDGHVTYHKDNKLLHTVVLPALDVQSNGSKTSYNVAMNATYDKTVLDLKGILVRKDNEFKLEIEKLSYGDTDLTGHWRINYKTKEVTGEFRSDALDLDTILGKPDANSSGEYTLPSKPIPVAFLRDSNVKFRYTIDELSYHEVILKNVVLNVSSKNKVLNFWFEPALNLDGGKLDLNIKYDLNDASPSLDLNLTATDVNFEKFLKDLTGKSPLSGSTLNVRSKLRSSGITYAALVGNASGTILLTASAGQYLNGSPGMGNIFANVLSGVITFNKSEADTTFTCGVMNFKVNDGIAVANRGVAIEAASVHVLGNGRVDLRNGRINFSIVPKNLNPINAIDITQFSMAQAVSVSGTISKPQVVYNPIDLINANNVIGAASLASKIVAWPLGVAAVAKNTIDPTTSDQGSPCAIALGK